MGYIYIIRLKFKKYLLSKFFLQGELLILFFLDIFIDNI